MSLLETSSCYSSATCILHHSKSLTVIAVTVLMHMYNTMQLHVDTI